MTETPTGLAARLLEAARLHRREGHGRRAEWLYRGLLALRPGLAEGWRGLGDFLAGEGRLKEATVAFHRATEAAPDDARALAGLGRVLARLDETAAARTALERAWILDPDDAETGRWLSAVLRRLRCKGEARRVLEETVSRHPLTPKPVAKGAARASILRLRGVEGAFYTLGLSGNGERKLKLSTGNFSTTYLLRSGTFDVWEYLVLEDNLLGDAPPEADVVINSIADPDVEAASLETVAAFLERHPKLPVINRPEAVLETARDENWQRLKDRDGLVFPVTLRLGPEGRSADSVLEAAAAQGVGLPFLMRRTGTQTGRSFERIDDRAALEAYLGRQAKAELYLIQYLEETVADGLFRKMRLFCIDGTFFPVVCHTDDTWNVHGTNRLTMMKGHDWMVADEEAFMADPRAFIGERAWTTLEGLRDVIGLDYFAVDFTVRRDGTVVVYETNAAVRHAFDHARNFAYLTPYMEAVTQAFEAMVLERAGKTGAP